KFYGPHLGILYGRRELLERLRPYKVRPASDDGPGRWETGTQNHECLAGLLGAFEYLADLGGSTVVRREAFEAAMQRIQEPEQALAGRLIGGPKEIRGIQIHGITASDQLDPR